MIKMKHTPGPWRAVETPYGPIDIFGASAESVVTVYRSDSRDPVMRRANARLIAAAPEMYEALRTTSANIRSLGPAGALDDVPMPYREWLKVVEDALSKAEGRS